MLLDLDLMLIIGKLEEARAKERKAFEAQGLINSGKTELTDAVEMKGTCERMCSPFEIETRNVRMEVHPFERVCHTCREIGRSLMSLLADQVRARTISWIRTRR